MGDAMNHDTDLTNRSLLSRVQPILDAVATVEIIAVPSAVAWSVVTTRHDAGRPGQAATAGRQQPSPPKEPISVAGASTEGSSNAHFAIIEYSDFQCPFCAAFVRDTLPSLREQYVKPGKLLLAFRHLPLPMHPFAKKAAETAVKRQEKLTPFPHQN
jgi:protein-disulfide isomerase